eukprot:CAMPEP_0170521044 /NCGR_PEP_ID=MMETSP0209-20121228/6371_1 /TAXON_ID=665100 ORGANISM="Litonotus pictus, Strain P1" /NCGR_SAMPLE_ID=MMETSP0209 /ASSEMBLY_ACC=CAM_ASM_000301 /LENGTH=222 /DNA_ID=CAMNT_0010807687 /DNA_START=1 /DNA_END=666 /DNA_ORIENTATION=-
MKLVKELVIVVVFVLCSKFDTVSSQAYSWATSSNQPYLCSNIGVSVQSGVSNSGLICAQTEYPLTEGGMAGGSSELKCSSGVIKCFAFAGYGKVGGSCDGDEFKEDPSGEWALMPLELANQIIGQSSFSLIADSRTSLNGVPVSVTNAENIENMKLKVVAYCDESISGISSGESSDDNSANDASNMSDSSDLSSESESSVSDGEQAFLSSSKSYFVSAASTL